MNTAQVFSLVLAIAAAGAYFNHRWLRWPPVLGLTGVSILMSLGMMAAGELGLLDVEQIKVAIGKMDFETLLLHWLLALLLFGGSLFVDTGSLKRWAGPIGMLASVGVIVSTAVTAGLLWVAAQIVGHPISLLWCALFGALISPTDPIASLSIVKKIGAPEAIEHKLVGESLFNDGTAVVLFLVLLGVVYGQQTSPAEITRELLVGPIGGAAVGLAMAWATLRAMRGIEHPPTEILMTLALALGSYAAAEALKVSAPIAAVAAGLLVGSRGRAHDMTERTRLHLDIFWGTLDELLNGALFVLIGLEIMILDVGPELILAGVAVWVLVLCARFVSVGVCLLPFYRRLEYGTWGLLTWGGLRGGISLALALSLPGSDANVELITITFVVVILSALGQGLSLGRFCQHTLKHQPHKGKPDAPVNRTGAGGT